MGAPALKRSRERPTAPGPKLIVPGAIEDYQSGLALIFVVDLAADLAARVVHCVHVDVGHARPDGLNDRSDIAGRNSLGRRADDIGGVDDSGYRRPRGSPGRAGRLAATAAEESSDAAGEKTASEVDMGEKRR